jgi:pyruvate dehydrogenase E2 component (dihydrolipoamide acetyltransferase)
MAPASGTVGRGEPTIVKLPMLRRAMVRSMVQAAGVPCFYLHVTADATEAVARRAALRECGEPSPSLNDYVLRATALALREHPHVNSAYLESTVAQFPRVNLGVAIAVEDGLVVPAVYDADGKDALALGRETRELADLARERRLTPDLLRDATFTVSNLGMYGIDDFDPVLNPPQAAILAVGAAAVEPQSGRTLMRLTLGCDHRVLTGVEGANFLNAILRHFAEARG